MWQGDALGVTVAWSYIWKNPWALNHVVMDRNLGIRTEVQRRGVGGPHEQKRDLNFLEVELKQTSDSKFPVGDLRPP